LHDFQLPIFSQTTMTYRFPNFVRTRFKIMDAKLTLRLDKDVIEQAKEYAREHGTSLSNMIERYLSFVSSKKENTEERQIDPLVQRLTGVISMRDDEDEREMYREYLAKKYE